FFGLMWSLYEHARANGYTHLYISGLREREMLYKRLGFEVIGAPVASGQALFIPMVLTIGQLPERALRVKHLWESHMQRVTPSRATPVCLLPGPVTIAPAVSHAFHQPLIYHRGPEFIGLFQKVRRSLVELVEIGRAHDCTPVPYTLLFRSQLSERALRVNHLWESHMQRVTPSRATPVCLLPGPVTIAPAVSHAFHQPLIYHRGPEFIGLFQKVRRSLGELV